ncbi:unnamed protein product [Allacma fusca]|uniref:Uncharacterized protein n=1 Tax=Allacma fusca TaxID=39272 RepID=A0A8J2K847_9HEXA|nr:unnamed protein product [Allacma fusca]
MDAPPGFHGQDHPNSSADVSGETSEQEEELPDIDYYHPVPKPAPANPIQMECPERNNSQPEASRTGQSSRRRSNELLEEAGPNKRKKLKKIFLLHFDWFKTKQKFGDTQSLPSCHATRPPQGREGASRESTNRPLHNPTRPKSNSPPRSEVKPDIQSRRSGNRDSPRRQSPNGKNHSTESHETKSPVRQTSPTLPDLIPNRESTTSQGLNAKSVGGTSRDYPNHESQGRLQQARESQTKSTFQVQNSTPKSLNRLNEGKEKKEDASATSMFEFMHKVPTGYTIPKRSNVIPIPI